jgi:hypothetical protein
MTNASGSLVRRGDYKCFGEEYNAQGCPVYMGRCQNNCKNERDAAEEYRP